MHRRSLGYVEAIQAALKVRSKAGIALNCPVCVLDLAEEKLGIEVQIVAVPSLEGLYSDEPPQIILSSLRPKGRRAFTCAHELGHHSLRHGGIRIDELRADDTPPTQVEEALADRFAAELLMPKTLVGLALSARGWSIHTLTHLQAYALANWLGVGYSTLISQMTFTHGLLTPMRREALLNHQPASIRTELLGFETSADLIVADTHWTGRPIDLEVGDLLLLPAGTQAEGPRLEVIADNEDRVLARAVRTGRSRVAQVESNWATFVRVSREAYTGQARFRHLEDDDELS